MNIFSQQIATREAYGEALVDLCKEDSRIVALGGDLNKSTFTHLFAKEYPDRFFDFGPAEQNIISVAAGMASMGKIPFINTFAVFGTCRPFDQLRIAVAQTKLNVKLVCTHAGILTGEDGISAHGIEDIGLISMLPGFTIICPSDAIETKAAIREAVKINGPVYIRLYRPPTPVINQEPYSFKVGESKLLVEGNDATIVATGSMVPRALQAACLLAGENINCRVLNVHTIKPLDTEKILLSAQETGALVTCEEHYRYGGLSSIVAQYITEKHPVPIEVVALEGYAESGTAEELLVKYKLTAKDICTAVKKVLKRK